MSRSRLLPMKTRLVLGSFVALAACGPSLGSTSAGGGTAGSATEGATSGRCELKLWPDNPVPDIPAECTPLLSEREIPVIPVRIHNHRDHACTRWTL
jgi:hypothetical protein